MYLFKTPWLVTKIWPQLTWQKPGKTDTIYLTFDDGPTTECTEWILEQLAAYQAKGTFFCVGENAADHPRLLKKIEEAGHRLGNHTHQHLNGWKTANTKYLENVAKCDQYLHSKLFRPPYGKISPIQAGRLQKQGYQVIMWSILSYDFSDQLNPDDILQNSIKHSRNGSIIVFHDNVKAFANLKEVLPAYLEIMSERGFKFAAL